MTDVIVGRDEAETVNGISDWETYYGNIRNQDCVRTSYNGNIRYNYAGIGFTYDADRDAFISPKPYESWVLDEETCRWAAPVPYPEDDVMYQWDEETVDWIATDYSEQPAVK